MPRLYHVGVVVASEGMRDAGHASALLVLVGDRSVLLVHRRLSAERYIVPRAIVREARRLRSIYEIWSEILPRILCAQLMRFSCQVPRGLDRKPIRDIQHVKPKRDVRHGAWTGSGRKHCFCCALHRLRPLACNWSSQHAINDALGGAQSLRVWRTRIRVGVEAGIRGSEDL